MKNMKLTAFIFSAEVKFEHLQKNTGFFDGGPRQLSTAMAVFVYFFGRCKIFENPEGRKLRHDTAN